MTKVAYQAGMDNGVRYITVFVGRPVKISSNDTRYKKVCEALAQGLSIEEVKALADPVVAQDIYVESVKEQGHDLEIKGDRVFLNGEEVHGSIAKRVLDFQKDNLPFEHLGLFLKNLKENPSYQSQQELYDFLEHKDLPITEDGCLLAYKSVDSDYKDHHTHSIDNSVGAKIERMKRSDVDDNRDVGCSKGYHAGSIQYVRGFGNTAGRHIMVVKVHPQDVVTIPKDSSCQKMRMCWYEIIQEMEEVFDSPLYGANAETVVSRQGVDNDYSANWDQIDQRYEDEEYDDEYEDEEEDYDYDDEDERSYDWNGTRFEVEVEEDDDEDYEMPQDVL